MRIRHSLLLNSTTCLIVLLDQMPPMTGRQLANVLALAYAGLGLTHLNNKLSDG